MALRRSANAGRWLYEANLMAPSRDFTLPSSNLECSTCTKAQLYPEHVEFALIYRQPQSRRWPSCPSPFLSYSNQLHLLVILPITSNPFTSLSSSMTKRQACSSTLFLHFHQITWEIPPSDSFSPLNALLSNNGVQMLSDWVKRPLNTPKLSYDNATPWLENPTYDRVELT